MDQYKQTANAYNKFAKAYQEKFMDLNIYDETYDALCKLLPDAANVFEIGCGPGNITRYLIRKRPDISIDATDIAPNMVALAQKNNPTANCFELDSRDLNRIQKHYDAIVCGFCLPYLAKDACISLIEESNRLLNSDGVLYLSTIEGREADLGYVWNSAKTDQIYIHYHSAEFIKSTLESNGFTIIENYRITYNLDATVSIHLVIIARKLN